MSVISLWLYFLCISSFLLSVNGTTTGPILGNSTDEENLSMSQSVVTSSQSEDLELFETLQSTFLFPSELYTQSQQLTSQLQQLILLDSSSFADLTIKSQVDHAITFSTTMMYVSSAITTVSSSEIVDVSTNAYTTSTIQITSTTEEITITDLLTESTKTAFARTSNPASTVQDITTLEPETTTSTPIITPTPCPEPNFKRPFVGLYENCGEYSISGICIVENSICIRTENISVWECRCSDGYTQANTMCKKIPDDLLTTNVWKYNNSNDFDSKEFDLDRLTGFNITNSSTYAVGECADYFSASIHNHKLNINFTMPEKQWKCDLSIILMVTVEKKVITDYVNLKIKHIKRGIEFDIYIIDGTKRGVVVGQIKDYSDEDNSMLSINDKYIHVGTFGIVYTKIDIDLDKMVGKETIACTRKINVSYNINVRPIVAKITVIFVRKHYFQNPLPETSSQHTLVGNFELQKMYSISNEAGFHFNGSSLLLGTMILDYNSSTEINENIVLGFNETQFKISITFKVIDVNNHSPYFVRAPYSFTTTQAAFSGVMVGAVESVDPDSDSTLEFGISPNDLLAIDKYGVITLKASIQDSDYYANVTVNDGIFTSQTTIHIKSEVKQEDSLGRLFTGSVEENTISNNITQVAEEGYENFRFFESDASSSFKVDKKTGIVGNTRAFDRENEMERNFKFAIIANKKGQPCSLVVVGKLTIKIEDQNDNSPIFLNSPYEAKVEEEKGDGELEMIDSSILAEDKDLTSIITYTLLNENTRFSIDNTTGVIRTLVPIDRETKPSILLKIAATDGLNTTKTTVNVTIVDINDNDPVFKIANDSSVCENDSVGTFVTSVYATDNDIGDNGRIQYEINPRGYFQIDAFTGVITIGVKLDRERSKQHPLTIFANDRGHPGRSASTRLNVQVLDYNDEAPEFDTDIISVYVFENHTCHNPITTTRARDKDEPGTNNSNITYKLINELTNFKIDPSSGEIRCETELDFETNKQHIVTVIATDRGTPTLSGSQTIQIDVVDVNDNHPFFVGNMENITIRYFIPSRLVAVVNVIDCDSEENGRVSYILSDNASSFLSISNRGVIKIQNTTKPDSKSYPLNITVSDMGNPQFYNSTMIMVTVISSGGSGNDQPIKFSQQDISMYVEEHSSYGTYIDSVERFVSHEKYGVAYEILNDFNLLEINRTNGMIFVIGDLDRETQVSHDIVVKAKAKNGSKDFSDLAVVRVHLNDTNDHVPVFNRLIYYFQMKESEKDGSLVHPLSGHNNITAVDPDVGVNAEIEYSIVEDNGCQQHFNINTHSDIGYITLFKSVDYEKGINPCLFNITAFNPNNKEKISTASVHIKIDDYNDNHPVFYGHIGGVYWLNISETVKIDEKVELNINVTDKDSFENGDIEVTNEGSCWLSFYKGRSDIVEIKVNASLDYDIGDKTNNCTIIANDKGNPSLSSNATVVIQLIDENDNSPEVNDTPISRNISRFAESGEVIIYKINVTDKDSGINQEIEFKLETRWQEYFTLDEKTGRLKLKSSIEHIDRDDIRLTISVSDKGEDPNSVSVQIAISIVDDNPRPFFEPNTTVVEILEHSIPHNTQRGHIGVVTAFDVKKNEKIPCDCDYKFKNKRDDIRIGLNNGIISFISNTSSFDREKEGANVTLIVIATDDGSPRKTMETDFIIKIIDINDQMPVFTEVEYRFKVFQDEDNGKVIGRVSAVDLDENPNTDYSINVTYSDFELDVVQINKTTGEIYKYGDFSLQNKSAGNITGFVFAKDSDDPFKPVGKALVKITVTDDKNEHYPIFTKDRYEKEIRWDHKPSNTILTVTANDGDSNREGQISYKIIYGNFRGYFTIQPNKGEISLTFQLDSSVGDNDLEMITLTVEAKDHGVIPKSNTTTVAITIKGDNPGPCIQGTAHNRQVNDLKRERQNWSYALYGLSGALCITILTTFVFVYKWRSATGIPKAQETGGSSRKDNSKEKYSSNLTQYEDLDNSFQRAETPYSISNQRFVPQKTYNYSSGWNEPEQRSKHYADQQRNMNFRNRWESSDESSNQHLSRTRNYGFMNRLEQTKQHSDARLILELNNDPFPDYLDVTNDPTPDYD